MTYEEYGLKADFLDQKLRTLYREQVKPLKESQEFEVNIQIYLECVEMLRDLRAVIFRAAELEVLREIPDPPPMPPRYDRKTREQLRDVELSMNITRNILKIIDDGRADIIEIISAHSV